MMANMPEEKNACYLASKEQNYLTIILFIML